MERGLGHGVWQALIVRERMCVGEMTLTYGRKTRSLQLVQRLRKQPLKPLLITKSVPFAENQQAFSEIVPINAENRGKAKREGGRVVR